VTTKAKMEGGRQLRCYYPGLSRSLRAVACVIVWVTTVVGMIAYEHYSVDEPPSGAFTAAVATGAALLTWLVTGLD
jgi:hypothetical protein